MDNNGVLMIACWRKEISCICKYNLRNPFFVVVFKERTMSFVLICFLFL